MGQDGQCQCQSQRPLPKWRPATPLRQLNYQSPGSWLQLLVGTTSYFYSTFQCLKVRMTPTTKLRVRVQWPNIPEPFLKGLGPSYVKTTTPDNKTIRVGGGSWLLLLADAVEYVNATSRRLKVRVRSASYNYLNLYIFSEMILKLCFFWDLSYFNLI